MSCRAVQRCWRTLIASTAGSVAFLAQCDADSVAPEQADWCTPEQRAALRAELAKVRRDEAALYARWERDEAGWGKLPPRAWPARQPSVDDIPGIRAGLAEAHCPELAQGEADAAAQPKLPDKCRELEFDLATALVFNNVDGSVGHAKYRALGHVHGDVESVVALGVCLVEGLACEPNESAGVALLERAAALDSAQACYELGSLQYMGTCDAVTEDEEAAFLNFEKAAAKGHAGALFMTADCLIEGTGVKELDPARAVIMLMAAANQGHRFARQRIRELVSADKERDIH